MAHKKKEAIRELHHPDGRVEVQYLDGSSEFIGTDGKPINLNALVISDAQLEAWKKEPREQALKEALELFKAQGMDISEAKFKLEVLKFISDLQGVLVSTPIQSQAIVVEINMGSEKRVEKIISTQTQPVE